MTICFYETFKKCSNGICRSNHYLCKICVLTFCLQFQETLIFPIFAWIRFLAILTLSRVLIFILRQGLVALSMLAASVTVIVYGSQFVH